MSIASTVAALERANAAYKAAQRHNLRRQTRQFRLVEREHRYSYLCGAYAGYVSFTPCIVSSVVRDGIVKEVRLAGQDWPLKRRDWHQINVDSAGRVPDPEAVAAKLVDDRGLRLCTATSRKRLPPSKRLPA
jgi:hypothetical protein